LGQSIYSGLRSSSIELGHQTEGDTGPTPPVDRGLWAATRSLRLQGLYGYFRRNLTGKKGQSGFTLIELLVVVAILGVLAAIVTLSLVGLTTNAQAKACEQEYKTVQAGLDAYMANNNVDSVTATTGTSDMKSPVLLYNDGVLNPIDGAHPTYVRNSPTQWAYVWNSSGRITAVAQASGGPAVPPGCTVSG
jgi:prepilin-type N-terminal cleavage/methylation domain-containing protein